jgi:hypothetical protein
LGNDGFQKCRRGTHGVEPHRLGSHGLGDAALLGSDYIWIIFAQSYLPRALSEPGYLPFAFLLLGPVVLGFMTRSRRSLASAVPS